MNWVLLVDSSLKRRLKKLPAKDVLRIIAIIQTLEINPYAGDIEKLKGEQDVWRRRVGAYRIFYEISQPKRVIYVFDVRRRASNTY